MISTKFRIVGKRWEIRLLSKKKYRKKNGDGSVAITLMHKRRIEVSPKGFDLETILHELVHAYLSELCIWSANLEDDNIEEVFAELLAKRGRELLDLGDKLLLELQKGKIDAQ